MTEMKVLSKMDILRQNGLKKELVEVPEWGGAVWVWELNAAEKDQWEQFVLDSRKGDGEELTPEEKNGRQGGTRLRLVMLAMKDENGQPMFTELDVVDLAKKSGRAIGRISSKALELSGMTADAQKQIKGNSETGAKEDSSSVSAEK